MVYEVNFQDREKYPPFSTSNNSVYVEADTKEQAIEIAMNKMLFKKKELCFCRALKTIG